jgi:hypothetical protein
VLEITLTSFEGGPALTTTAITERRELAHRTGDGIEITLLWSKGTNTVTLAVSDTHADEAFEFEVDGGCALDAFHHPYAYAALRCVRTTHQTPLTATR